MSDAKHNYTSACATTVDGPYSHPLDSIEAVEAGLRAFDGALLVVSHDESFLKAIGITRRIHL